jgi:pilus assembly protein CpaE
MKTQALVVADDPVYLSWLQGAAGGGADFSLLRPVDAEDLIQRVQAGGRVDLVFFQFDAANAPARAVWMERLLERVPDLPVAGVGEDGQPEVVLAAMRAGARDFLVLRRDDTQVAALIGKLLRRTVGGPRGAKQGRVYALIGADADPATAFAAEHLALTTLEQLPRGERVVLVDLSLPAGSAAVFLNINQTYSVLDAINDVFRCDQTLVDSAFSKHTTGLFVLSLPEDLVGRPGVNGEDLLKLLQVFRGLFAATFVTLDGQYGTRVLSTIVGAVDRALLLSDQSILRSRHSKYLLRSLRLEDTAMDRFGLVVDGYRRRHGLEPDALAELLELPLLAALSSDELARQQAMDTGESLFQLAPKNPWCRDVRKLAEALASGRPVEREAPGLLDKLFG